MGTRFPFPLPSGWFQVAYSDELKPGQAMPLRCFGRDLVAFRGENGVVSVLDAHCPHLGAHLGHGGRVCGNHIVCPFHAWEFDHEGRCSGIPYTDKVPKQASIRSWPVRELADMIMVYHDLENGPPTWDLPEISEFDHDDWTPFERRSWTIRTCHQEMAENSVDAAHFQYLHGTASMPETVAKIQNHVFHAISTTTMTTPAGPVEGQIEVHCYGFGLTTTRFTGIVETFLVSTPTAIDDEHCVIRFNFTVRKIGGRSITSGVGKAFVAEVSRQLEQDIPIWENKVFKPRPVLCDGDGPIGLFRNWVKQFYPATHP